MSNPSSYKYLDQAPLSLFFTVVCSGTKITQNDVLGAVMSVPSAHPTVSISTLLESKSLGRIKITETTTDTTKDIQKFDVEVPLKGHAAVWSLLSADIEQISFVGSGRAKFTLKQVRHNNTQRESKSLTRAEEIIREFNTSSEEGEKRSKVLEFFSKVGYTPDLWKQEIEKITPIDKDKGIYGSPSYNTATSIILVEGVSDIRTLIRAGYDNVISVNGYKINQSINDLNNLLRKKEEVIIFMDGDRGGKTICNILKEKLTCSNLRIVEEDGYGEVQLLTKLQIDSILSRRKPYKPVK